MYIYLDQGNAYTYVYLNQGNAYLNNMLRIGLCIGIDTDTGACTCACTSYVRHIIIYTYNISRP